MIVFYKFENSTICDKVYFDGSHISVANLRMKIVQQQRLGDKQNFNLKITNAQTKEEYMQDSCLIPRNSSLLVARVPLKFQNNHSAMRAKKTTDSSMLACKRKNAVQQGNGINPSKCKKMRDVLRQTADVSTTDRCSICQKIENENCPLNGHCPVKGRHQSKPHTEVKRNASECSRIPQASVDAKSALNTAEPLNPPPVEPTQTIPEQLNCSICKGLMKNAVKINCCGSSFCEECISKALRESTPKDCPICQEKPLADNIHLNDLFRLLKSGTTNNELCQAKETVLVPKVEGDAQESNHVTSTTVPGPATIAVARPDEAKSSQGGGDMEHRNNSPNSKEKKSTSNPTTDREASASISTQFDSSPVSHSTRTNATESKSNEPNAEPIIIDDDDDDVIFVDDLQSQLVASNIIEVDTVDESLTLQTIERIVNEYNENEIDTTAMTVVRPWMNDDSARKSCINAISQFALYKCMQDRCHFATNSSELFRKHMEMHEQVIEHYEQKHLLDDGTHERLTKFRGCAYCCYKSESNGQLIGHMENVHRSSILQCPHCFYRTIEVDNMLLHMNTYHPSSSEAILLCGEKRGLQSHDEDILKNADQNVKKLRCGQNQGAGQCTEEFACYNHLHGHLAAEHGGTYQCPYCSETMTMDEYTITAHLTSAAHFPEFQCLLCEAAFDTIQAIRMHMALDHAANYLFIGSRRSSKPFNADHLTDKIQLVYANETEEQSSHNLTKCSQHIALNAMDPMELIPSQQLVALEQINADFQHQVISFSGPVPRIFGSTLCDIIKYKTYEVLTPLTVQYKCITGEIIDGVNAIDSYIDRSMDVDDTLQCNFVTSKGVSAMLRHRCQRHSSQPIAFLQIEQRASVRTHKIVRCKFQCHRCHMTVQTRAELIRHFNRAHPNHWIAAKFLMESHKIESAEPKAPPIQSVDFFYSSALACVQPNCMMIGTRTQAIEHHNQHHHHAMADNIDRFEFALGEKIVPNTAQRIASYVREINKPHQIYLFQCLRCFTLFESLAKTQHHFSTAERCTNDDGVEMEPRFRMKKLFRCCQDKVIRTFAGMKLHYADKHPGEPCTPVNILEPKKFCGLCDFQYKRNNDLNAHYVAQHAFGGDSYSDKLLHSLNLNETIDIDQCAFVVQCCALNGQQPCQLQRIVDHLITCEGRFVCQQCTNAKFTSTMSFVMHCIEHDAGANSAKIVGNLQNTKKVLAQLQTMTIIMPNGLILTVAEIRNTAFYQNILSVKIMQLMQDAWTREQADLRPLTVMFNAPTKPLENETATEGCATVATAEQTNASETSNDQNQNQNDETLCKPLSSNTDGAIEAADSRPSSSESHQIPIQDQHSTFSLESAKILENSSTNEDDGAIQLQQTEPIGLNLKPENSQIPCEKIAQNVEGAESNAAVESDDIAEASGSCKLQRDRKIRRVMTGAPRYNGVKCIKTKPHPKKLIVEKKTSFGSFVDTLMCKITNQQNRDKTERDILQLVYNRIAEQPTMESGVNRNGFHMDATERSRKLEKPTDGMLDGEKTSSADERKKQAET